MVTTRSGGCPAGGRRAWGALALAPFCAISLAASALPTPPVAPNTAYTGSVTGIGTGAKRDGWRRRSVAQFRAGTSIRPSTQNWINTGGAGAPAAAERIMKRDAMVSAAAVCYSYSRRLAVRA